MTFYIFEIIESGVFNAPLVEHRFTNCIQVIECLDGYWHELQIARIQQPTMYFVITQVRKGDRKQLLFQNVSTAYFH